MWQSFVSNIEIIEELAKQVIPSISIREKRGLPDGTYCSIDEYRKPVLYWDSLMYEFFEKELILLDTFQYEDGNDDKLITEMRYNYLGVLFDHLSEKNKSDLYICDALKIKANSFNYPFFAYMCEKIPEVSEWKTQFFIQTGVFKLLIMYHEIAHCLFSLNASEREKWEDVVVRNLELLHQHGEETLFFQTNNKKSKKEVLNLLKKLRNRDNSCQDVLSELAADAFALSKAYATTHLNIHDVNAETLSDNIMVAYLRYLDISSQYGYIVNYWKELYNMCIIRKKKSEAEDALLMQKSVENSIRCELWGIVSMINIIQFDVETWDYVPSKGITLADPRLKNAIHVFMINATSLFQMTSVAVNPKLFNAIVEESNQLKDNDTPHYEYPVIPDGTLVITWLSVQYYNSRGCEKLKKGNYREAIKDFRLAASITEQYLGYNHKLNARVINNICTCYLGIAKQTPKMLNEDSTISFLESVELASYHSSYALSIIKEIKADEDIQAGCIYQNAADILTMMGQDEAAIGYYQRAKYIKAKNYGMYTESNALTDYSMAQALYRLNRFLDAKNSCIEALSFYRQNLDKDDPTRMEAEDFFEKLQYKMDSTGGALLNIISSLNKGEVVNLNQYSDI